MDNSENPANHHGEGAPTIDRAARILEHVDEGIMWYDENATRTMRYHHALGITAMLSAAFVPIFALSSGSWPKYVAAVLGAVAGSARGVEALFRYNEKYVSWRFTNRALVCEKYEYEVRIGPYLPTLSDEAAIDLLAARVETLTTSENDQWVALANKPSDGSAKS